MYTRCPKCGIELVDPGQDFLCIRCGSPIRSLGAEFVEEEEGLSPFVSIALSEGPRWKAILIALQHLVRLSALVLFALSLVLCFAALLYGVPLVFQNALGSGYGDWLFILVPVPLPLVAVQGPSLLVYYAIIVAALLASGALLLYNERRRLVAGLGKTLTRLRAPDRHDTESGLVQLPQVFLAVFFFDLFFFFLVELAGASPNVPAFEKLPLWYQFFTFARASVYEEFAARILLCGLPLLVAYYLAYFARIRAQLPPPGTPAAPVPSSVLVPQQAARAPRKEPGHQSLVDYLRSRTTRGLRGYVLGGGFRMGPLEAFFITGSALMFGLAHVPGWDIWKLLPTFIAGLGFAYLFLKVGLHAAILLHFSFDYLDLAFGLVPGFAAVYVLMALLWLVAGAFYFGHYLVQGSKWAIGMARGRLSGEKG